MSQSLFEYINDHLDQNGNNEMSNVIVDQFGHKVKMVPVDEGHFTVEVEVAVSPQFFAWVFGFGAEAEILAPERVRQLMAQQAAQIAALYREG